MLILLFTHGERTGNQGETKMDVYLERGIDKLGKYTNGRFDIWALAGPNGAKYRAEIMGELCGRKVPQSKAGVTAIRAEFYDRMQLHGVGSCEAHREDAFIRRCREICPEHVRAVSFLR